MTPIDPAARANVHLIDHPLVQHKLTLMRNKEASTSSFRRLLGELAALMIYEVCRDMPLQELASRLVEKGRDGIRSLPPPR